MSSNPLDHLRGLCDRVLVDELPESLRQSIRDGVAAGCTKREIMRRCKAAGAGPLLTAAVGAAVDEELRRRA